MTETAPEGISLSAELLLAVILDTTGPVTLTSTAFQKYYGDKQIWVENIEEGQVRFTLVDIEEDASDESE